MKKKVTVALYGGLGNQLFQYATGLAVAKHNAASLFIDLSWFDIVHKMPNTTQRKFALAPFGIDAAIQERDTSFLNRSNIFKRIFDRLSRKFGLKSKRSRTTNELNFCFDPSIFQLQCPIRLNGYWQSPKYFESITNEIRDIFASPRALSSESAVMMKKIVNSESICAHVRRGDYVTSKQAAETHGLCDLDYYKKGIEIVLDGMINPHCYVFSDDPDWVRKNFNVGIPMTVVDINGPDDAHQDLWLMSACQRFVIANSSLSWWGAYLSKANGKQVVAPKNWFAEKKYDSTDLIPADWQRI